MEYEDYEIENYDWKKFQKQEQRYPIPCAGAV
jgi:hypothetical protein